jgi:hypothetical protein
MARALFLTAALLMAVTPAAADEAPAEAEPAECGIRIHRAPDDARVAIAAELARDPAACREVLDVWIVPSQGGLYVQSRDSYGRVRERVVPDAATAAILLLSWVEIDTVEPLWRSPEPTPAPEAEAEVVAEAPAPSVSAPGVVAPTPMVAERAPTETGGIRARAAGASAVVELMASGLDGSGYRGDLELGKRRGLAWTISAGVMMLDGYTQMNGPLDPFGTHETIRTSGEIVVTATKRLGTRRFALVPGLGVGLHLSRHEAFTDTGIGNPSYDWSGRSVGPRLEGSFLVSVRTFGHVHLETGIRLSLVGYKQYTGEGQLPIWLDTGFALQLGLRWRP